MTLDVPPELEADLSALAEAEGISPEAYLRRMLEREVQAKRPARKPLKTYRGVFAKYGPAPSKEEIDENRRDMFKNFARDDAEW